MSSTPTVEVGALFTDLYELTMARAYDARGMTATAVFEVFFRRLPPGRAYAVAAGLDDVVRWLEDLRFAGDDLAYLRGLRLFDDAFLARLADVRFTGDVWAVPEGTVVFPHEPIVQVVAPILEAQLAETYVLNQVHLQTVLASKASRVVDAAAGRPVVDFGARRAHGTDAALKAARAAYLAGAAGTSNVLAGRRYGIPVFGTMAHSFVQAFDDEAAAFEAFAAIDPETTLLVDTYDTLAGVDRVIALARRLGDRFRVRAVRLDSGDLAELARAARARLDAAGLRGVGIFASSSLDEHELDRLRRAGAPIDGYGVGTHLTVADDAPTLDMAYKLVAYAGRPRTKRSPGKVLYPGRKQVHRRVERGQLAGDVVVPFGEAAPGEPLLVQVMAGGRRTARLADLAAARAHLAAERARLPAALRRLDAPAAPPPVEIRIPWPG